MEICLLFLPYEWEILRGHGPSMSSSGLPDWEARASRLFMLLTPVSPEITAPEGGQCHRPCVHPLTLTHKYTHEDQFSSIPCGLRILERDIQ